MATTFSVKIPTTSVLKKFIQTRYLEIDADAIKISNSNLLGTTIISLLNKNDFSTRFTLAKKLSAVSYYKDNIICVAPWSLFNNYGNKITLDQAIQINRFFDNYFDEELYIFCQKFIAGNQSRYCGYDKAINSFCDFYKIIIDEDITFDTLKKREYRLRTKINNKNLATLSPQYIHTKNIQKSFF